MIPIAITIPARARNLDGAFTVGRVLPAPARRHVGPFVFLDHMGPVTFAPGIAADIRPHPHIGLATITYLFEGRIRHHDSLGSDRVIEPGDVNLMIAGRGVVHSERTPTELLETGFSLHGLQLWIALPAGEEERAASFHHHADLPAVTHDGARVRVVIGSALGVASQVPTLSPTLLLDVALSSKTPFSISLEHDEIALYAIDGDVTLASVADPEARVDVPARTLAVLEAGTRELTIEPKTSARVMILGGAFLGDRHMFWNFVSSSEDRIEAAARDWKAGAFPKVPGDDVDFIPLHDDPPRIKKAGNVNTR